MVESCLIEVSSTKVRVYHVHCILNWKQQTKSFIRPPQSRCSCAVPTLVYYPSIPFLTSVALMAGTDKPPIAPKARKRTAGSFGRGRQQFENKNSFFITYRFWCFSLDVWRIYRKPPNLSSVPTNLDSVRSQMSTPNYVRIKGGLSD